MKCQVKMAYGKVKQKGKSEEAEEETRKE